MRLGKATCCSSQGREKRTLLVLTGHIYSTLSQQLAVLRTEGMVTTCHDGKNIQCRIADASVLKIVAVLQCLYCPEKQIE